MAAEATDLLKLGVTCIAPRPRAMRSTLQTRGKGSRRSSTRETAGSDEVTNWPPTRLDHSFRQTEPMPATTAVVSSQPAPMRNHVKYRYDQP